jgi:hypothetical protein
MKQITPPALTEVRNQTRARKGGSQTSSSISRISALNFSSNWPRMPEPAMIAERSIERTRLLCRDWNRNQNEDTVPSERGMRTSGTSFATILLASPSRIAVLPTPGGPMSCSTSSTHKRRGTIASTDHGVRLCPPRQNWQKTGSGDEQGQTVTRQETHTLDGTPDLCTRGLDWGKTSQRGPTFLPLFQSRDRAFRSLPTRSSRRSISTNRTYSGTHQRIYKYIYKKEESGRKVVLVQRTNSFRASPFAYCCCMGKLSPGIPPPPPRPPPGGVCCA